MKNIALYRPFNPSGRLKGGHLLRCRSALPLRSVLNACHRHAAPVGAKHAPLAPGALSGKTVRARQFMAESSFVPDISALRESYLKHSFLNYKLISAVSFFTSFISGAIFSSSSSTCEGHLPIYALGSKV